MSRLVLPHPEIEPSPQTQEQFSRSTKENKSYRKSVARERPTAASGSFSPVHEIVYLAISAVEMRYFDMPVHKSLKCGIFIYQFIKVLKMRYFET